MRYVIRYHEISSDWMVFNMGDGFKPVGMHVSEEDAIGQVKELEKRDAKLVRFSKPTLKQAA